MGKVNLHYDMGDIQWEAEHFVFWFVVVKCSSWRGLRRRFLAHSTVLKDSSRHCWNPCHAFEILHFILQVQETVGLLPPARFRCFFFSFSESVRPHCCSFTIRRFRAPHADFYCTFVCISCEMKSAGLSTLKQLPQRCMLCSALGHQSFNWTT